MVGEDRLAQRIDQEGGLAIQRAAVGGLGEERPAGPSASGASNSTGNLPVRRQRADRRDSVRSAA